VHYGALALLLLGIALMIGEAFTPGVIVLGIGGVVAFLVGAFFLFEGPGADIEIAVSLPLIVGAAMTTAGMVFGVVAFAFKARARPPAAGAEQMIGMRGQVVDWDAERAGCARTEKSGPRAQTSRCNPAILCVWSDAKV
jgi:membrane-bound serine protease (ClpP class)